jgi:outer membrane protein TolC
LAAKQQYLQAKMNAIQAYSVYIGDTASLYQSLGGGWRDAEEAQTPASPNANSSPAEAANSK